MEKDDVQLIHRILDGDNEAFSTLVRKYQRSVHALACGRLAIFTMLKKLPKTPSFRYTKNSQV